MWGSSSHASNGSNVPAAASRNSLSSSPLDDELSDVPVVTFNSTDIGSIVYSSSTLIQQQPPPKKKSTKNKAMVEAEAPVAGNNFADQYGNNTTSQQAVHHHSPSNSATHVPASASSLSISALAASGDIATLTSTIKQLKRFLKTQHRESEALKVDYEQRLLHDANRIQELENEISLKNSEKNRVLQEADRIEFSMKSLTQRHKNLQNQYQQLQEQYKQLQEQATSAKKSSGWLSSGFGMGSMLTGGMVGRSSSKSESSKESKESIGDDNSSSSTETGSSASAKIKKLSDDLLVIQTELMSKINENQNLHLTIESTRKEHENIVETLQRKIEESSKKFNNELTTHLETIQQLQNKLGEYSKNNEELQRKVNQLSQQLSSSSSSNQTANAADASSSELIREKHALENMYRVMRMVWMRRMPFDDEKPLLMMPHYPALLPSPSPYSSALSLTPLNTISHFHHKFRRSHYEILSNTADSLQKNAVSKISKVLLSNLTKYWNEKWNIISKQTVSNAALTAPPSQTHIQLLQTLTAQLSTQLDALQQAWNATSAPLRIIAGKASGAVPVSSSSPSSSSSSSDLTSSTLLLEPLMSVLHLISQIASLHAATLELSTSNSRNVGSTHSVGYGTNMTQSSNAASFALISQMRNHVHQLCSAWKALQQHLQKGAVAIAAIMDAPLPPMASVPSNAVTLTNASSQPASPNSTHTTPPPAPIALLLQSSHLTSPYCLPAAWLFEWLLLSRPESIGGNSSGAPGGATLSSSSIHHAAHSSAAGVSPAVLAATTSFTSTGVLSYLQTLQSLLTEVSSRFAVVSMHEHRASTNQQGAANTAVEGADTTTSTPSSSSSSDSASAAIARSKLSELNNKLLMGLSALPKLIELSMAALKDSLTQSDTLKRTMEIAERQTFLQVHQAQFEAERKEARTVKQQQIEGEQDTSGEHEDETNDALSNPFQPYLREAAILEGQPDSEYEGISDRHSHYHSHHARLDHERHQSQNFNQPQQHSEGVVAVSTTHLSSRLHSRCTSFLSSINRYSPVAVSLNQASVPRPLTSSTSSSLPVPSLVPATGLAYSFALQQRSDYHQLQSDFSILQSRYTELQNDHEHLSKIHMMLSMEQQKLLEDFEKNHDLFATVQLDYFEEKKARELASKNNQALQGRVNQLKNEVTTLKDTIEGQKKRLEKLQNRRKRKEEGEEDGEEMMDGEEDHPNLDDQDDDAAGSIRPRAHPSRPARSRFQLGGGDEIDSHPTTLRFDSSPVSSSHFQHQHQQPGSSIPSISIQQQLSREEEDAALIRAFDGVDSHLADDDMEDAPVVQVELEGSAADHHSLTLKLLSTPAPLPRSRPSDWLLQARQFEQILDKHTSASASTQHSTTTTANKQQATQHTTTTFSVEWTVETEENQQQVEGVTQGLESIEGIGVHSTSSAAAGAFMTPLVSHSSSRVAAASTTPLTRELLAAIADTPPLATVSAAALKRSPTVAEEADTNDENEENIAVHEFHLSNHVGIDASVGSDCAEIYLDKPNTTIISLWSFHQLIARLKSSELTIKTLLGSNAELKRSNLALFSSLEQSRELLGLLHQRYALSQTTSNATLERLQELQIERSEQLHTYTLMMDEMNEKILQLTQQLAHKDERIGLAY